MSTYTAIRGSMWFAGAKYSSNSLIVKKSIGLTEISGCVVWYTVCDNLVLSSDQELCQTCFENAPKKP